MESLQITWFVLWSVLWVVYFALDGFDLGSGILMNFISQNDDEKRAVINTVGPFWDGNEVWLITAGGATFAAFPKAYANMFSWFYIPLFMVLIGLILRGVSFEMRGKTESKKIWDIFIFVGSFLPVFLFGVAFGNIWSGVNITEKGYTEGTLGLLNFNGILTGFTFVVFVCMHGALWLYYKIEGEFKLRIYGVVRKTWYVSAFLFGIFILFIPHTLNPNFNLNSFSGYLTVVFYGLAAFMIILIKKSIDKGRDYISFLKSFVFMIFWFAGGFASQYPNLIPSKNVEFNVSIFNSSSSFYTLKIMTIVALIFVPIVVAYQIWIYKILNHKINPADKESLFY